MKTINDIYFDRKEKNVFLETKTIYGNTNIEEALEMSFPGVDKDKMLEGYTYYCNKQKDYFRVKTNFTIRDLIEDKFMMIFLEGGEVRELSDIRVEKTDGELIPEGIKLIYVTP